MSDARNKWRKIEHDESIAARMDAQLARDRAWAAANPLPRCRCGHSHYDTRLYAGGGIVGVCCLGCWPNNVEKPPMLQP